MSWSPDRSLSSLRLVAGSGPSTANEVVIDRSTMDAQHWSVGQTVKIITPNAPPRPFHVTGIVTFGTQNSLLGATIIAFPLPSAEQLLTKPGYVQQINVAVKPGADVNAVIAGVNGAVPANLEAVTGAVAAQQMANQVNQFIGIINTFLLTFALIALFVGAFLIANTFSILIGQRTRELALLRAVGASRSQVTRSMLGEALVVGLGGSVVGLAIGIPIALGLQALLGAFGFAPPATGHPGAAAHHHRVPAGGHRRHAPIGSRPRPAGLPHPARGCPARRRRRGGRLSAAPGVCGWCADTGRAGSAARRTVRWAQPADPGGRCRSRPDLHRGRHSRSLRRRLSGPSSSAPRFPPSSVSPASWVRRTRPAIRVAPQPPPRRSWSGSPWWPASARSVRRSTHPSAPLSTGRCGPRTSLTTSGQDQISRVAEPVAGAAPGVVAISPYTQISWHEGRTGKQATAVDPATAPQVLTFVMLQGSYDNLARGQVLVDDKVFRDRHLRLGETLPMGFVDTGVTGVPIGGTYKTNQFLGNYVVSYDFAAHHVTQLQDQAIFIKTGSVGPSEQAALNSALSQYPNLKVQTAAQYKADQKKQFGTLLNLVYVLLAFSILIASFGVVNTMALSVIERTREIGLLRSIGMGRRQVRAMIRGEAVVVALLGALLGLALGIAFGAAIVHAASGSGISILAIPVSTVVVVLIVAALIGVVAAVFPARRAARLDILQAIATE